MPKPKQHLPGSNKPRPMTSLVAAAKRISSTRIQRQFGSSGLDEEAWDLWSTIGELRFVSTQVARAVGKARLVVASEPDGSAEPNILGDDLDDERTLTAVEQAASELMDGFAGGHMGRAVMLQRLGLHLFVVGESFIVGLNDDDDPEAGPDHWFALAGSEITAKSSSGGFTINTGDVKRDVPEDAAVVTRVWLPHPRRWWEPDSPVFANFDVLRELVGLTKHVNASVDSRLAGAGLLVLPNSVTLAGGGNNNEEIEDDSDPFVEELIDMMVTPIKDRESAAAVVPLVIRVPDDQVGNIQHLLFSQPFDPELRELREEAIRRLALGLDAPPEVLLGNLDSNHWSAWLSDEQFVELSVEPMLALIADAITVGFLRPALSEMGFSDDEVNSVLVWYDLSDLVSRPNLSTEAQAAFDRGAISESALRRAMGFSDADAPETAEVDEAVTVAFDLIRAAPSLAQDPGIAALVDQIRAVLGGDTANVQPDAPAGEEPAADGPPSIADAELAAMIEGIQ